MRLVALMVVAVIVVGLGGCHDYDHFHDGPDGIFGEGDFGIHDLAEPAGDLAGCPATAGGPPSGGVGCSVYTFGGGVPAALTVVKGQPDILVEPACNMLHVRLTGGLSHDLWIDDIGAARIEETVPRTGPFVLSARVHGALDQTQKFSGVYAADNPSQRFISVQTTADSTGLHDHDVVFDYGATGAEQAMYPTATAAPGDSYGYTLERNTDTTQFRLAGSQMQTLTVSAPAALTPGVVVGNCCGGSAPAFDAYVEWMMVCQ